MQSESRPTNDAAGRSWESRLFQYGLGLIVLGLIGLLLPTFGWQLHRLRMLGSAQWVVLVIAVTVGSGAVVWSQRRRPALGGSIAGGALAAMLLGSAAVIGHIAETARPYLFSTAPAPAMAAASAATLESTSIPGKKEKTKDAESQYCWHFYLSFFTYHDWIIFKNILINKLGIHDDS